MPLLSFLLLLAQPQAGSAEALHFLEGPSPNAHFGYSMAWASDRDGDGMPDLLVGAPGAGFRANDSGAVFLYSSKDGRTLLSVTNRVPGARMGTAVVDCGDLNGDGIGDLLVGLPGTGYYLKEEGSVWLVNGKNANTFGQINGTQSGEELGSALAAPGDLNGDGFPDIVVGAPGFGGKAGKECGAVRAFSGKSRELLFEVEGTKRHGRFGEVLAPVPDIDGDQIPDFIASSRSSGEVFLISGAFGDVIHHHEGNAETQFGFALCSTGDLNSDRIPDYAIGEPRASGEESECGKVHIYSGKDGSLMRSIEGVAEGGRLGTSLSPLDIGDPRGGSDLLVGAPGKGEGGTCVLFDPLSGTPLMNFIGSVEAAEAGHSVVGLNLLDPLGNISSEEIPKKGVLLAFSSPKANDGGRENQGSVNFFRWTPSATNLEEEDLIGGLLAFAETSNSAAAGDVLGSDPKFDREKWDMVADPLGRWTLWSSVKPKLAKEAADLLSRTYARLDSCFGDSGAKRRSPPVTLVLAGSIRKQDSVADALQRAFTEEHQLDWIEEGRMWPHMLNRELLFALVRDDKSTKLIKRPEVQLMHFAVHLEFTRRFSAIPAWLPEAVSYGLQDEVVGEIYGYNNRVSWEKLADDYHIAWRERTADLLAAAPLKLASLFGEINQPFDQTRAYERLAFGLWLINQPSGALEQICLKLIAKRRWGSSPNQDCGINDDAQIAILRSALDENIIPRTIQYWESVSLDGGPRARRTAAMTAIENVARKQGFLILTDEKGSFRLMTDLKKSSANKALSKISTGIRFLEKALGRLPMEEGETPPTIFLLNKVSNYRYLCDEAAKAVPGIANYLNKARESVGFTLPRLPYTVYFDDKSTQEESNPTLSALHNITHLWLRKAYGELPLWLKEGIATGLEEKISGTVYGNWNAGGFVYSWTHGSWRKRAKEFVTGTDEVIEAYDWTDVDFGTEPPLIKMVRPTLFDLYSYRATTYREEMAHIAFAFAIYGLEKNKGGLKKFCKNLQKEYDANWITVGRFEPSAEWTDGEVRKSFGKDFHEQFVAWWQEQ